MHRMTLPPRRSLTVDEARDLCARAQHGDQVALAQLWTLGTPILMSYIRRRVPSWVDVEDLVSEVWARAIRALPNLDTTRNVLGWLQTIAHNLIVDVARSATRAEISRCVDELAELPDPGPGPELWLLVAADRWDQRQVLAEGLQQLTAGQRRAMRARLEGLSITQTAEAMCLAPDAVKALMYRATQRLRATAERRALAVAG